jgi:hypothetical protein
LKCPLGVDKEKRFRWIQGKVIWKEITLSIFLLIRNSEVEDSVLLFDGASMKI